MGSLTRFVFWALLCRCVLFPGYSSADPADDLRDSAAKLDSSADIVDTPRAGRTHPGLITGHGYTVGEFASVADLNNRGQALLEELLVRRSVLRHEVIDSPLGSVNLSYPDSFRDVLAKDPKQTVETVLGVAGQLLIDSGFPAAPDPGINRWHIVIVSSVPKAVSTGLLSSSLCHTAWTGPPATIVIAADRLGTKCGREQLSQREVLDAFRDVLFHELGHVIEFRLMGEGFGRRKRWHGEGFAMWFESLAKQRLQGEAGATAVSEKKAKAREAFSPDWHEYLFSGTAGDYLQSYGRIAAIAGTQSVSRLIQVYQRMSRENCPFTKAVELELGWDEEQWTTAAAEFLGF